MNSGFYLLCLLLGIPFFLLLILTGIYLYIDYKKDESIDYVFSYIENKISKSSLYNVDISYEKSFFLGQKGNSDDVIPIGVSGLRAEFRLIW